MRNGVVRRGCSKVHHFSSYLTRFSHETTIFCSEADFFHGRPCLLIFIFYNVVAARKFGKSSSTSPLLRV